MAANFETYSVNNQPPLAFVFVSQMWLSEQKAIMRLGFFCCPIKEIAYPVMCLDHAQRR